jgi:hypothetical protein
MRWLQRLLVTSALALSLGVSARADAFCGFYVGGAGGELYNNATQVVLMREGTRTVLSMANNYQGPPENFAMVVPVPVVLQKENVKTLPRDLFKKVDQLAAPRLVEYWEQDPCAPVIVEEGAMPVSAGAMPPSVASDRGGGGLGVKVEAQFTVGEYEVVILSAKDSSGLETWLKQEKYNIPAGAEPVLKPYVQAGMKFFVAKVNLDKVTKEGDKTMLSPLRFHYDSEKFDLPVRLGLLNSSGKQDLLVHILAKGKRYEVANYPNVTIPTNLDVGEITKGEFATFYAALFDQTLEKNPKAVVTEYSWDASTCDPCPGPTLSAQDTATLGADVLPSGGDGPPPGAQPGFWMPSGFVLTRLHARYSKDSLGEDLVFKEAPAIAGGREVRRDGKTLEQGATAEGGMNNFQGRYAVRHPWKGPATCKEPRFGRWGGPPAGVNDSTGTKAATNTAFAPRGKTPLASFLTADLPALGVKVKGAASAVPVAPATATGSGPAPGTGAVPGTPAKNCTGCAIPAPEGNAAAALLTCAGVGLMMARRRRRS